MNEAIAKQRRLVEELTVEWRLQRDEFTQFESELEAEENKLWKMEAELYGQ